MLVLHTLCCILSQHPTNGLGPIFSEKPSDLLRTARGPREQVAALEESRVPSSPVEEREGGRGRSQSEGRAPATKISKPGPNHKPEPSTCASFLLTVQEPEAQRDREG